MGGKSKKQSQSERKAAPFFDDSPAIMLDSSECSVDNFKALLDFSGENVRISTSDGVVRITGKKLEISSVTDESISIKGVISSLEFE